MKEKKLSKKLVLNKERIAQLNDLGMANLQGGMAASDSCEFTCYDTCQLTKCVHCPGPTTDITG
jgi:hypothetical protein